MKNQPNDIATNTIRYWQIATVVLFVALASVALHAYVFFWDNAGHDVEEVRAKYPLIDPARHLIAQEHFLSTLQPLRERVHALVEEEAKRGVHVSVYIEFLNTGANISVNNDERYWPASLAKVPLAMAVMGTIESGIWTLDQVVTLEESDKTEISSRIHTNPVGTKFTVRELLEALLIHSDNTAYYILGRNVPVSEVSAVREAIGLEQLFDQEGEVTAREYSRLFRSLYTASYLNRQNSQFLLDLLNRAAFTDFLRDPVPGEVPFPHKFGMGPSQNTYSDSGIVYVENRPYLITVLVRAEDEMDDRTGRLEAARIMNTISQAAYAYFTTAQNREL